MREFDKSNFYHSFKLIIIIIFMFLSDFIPFYTTMFVALIYLIKLGRTKIYILYSSDHI